MSDDDIETIKIVTKLWRSLIHEYGVSYCLALLSMTLKRNLGGNEESKRAAMREAIALTTILLDYAAAIDQNEWEHTEESLRELAKRKNDAVGNPNVQEVQRQPGVGME